MKDNSHRSIRRVVGTGVMDTSSSIVNPNREIIMCRMKLIST